MGLGSYRSTLTQQLSHWDKVLDHLESGESVTVIYTDFSKAFDKCEANVFLITLKECGGDGKSWNVAGSIPGPQLQKASSGS